MMPHDSAGYIDWRAAISIYVMFPLAVAGTIAGLCVIVYVVA